MKLCFIVDYRSPIARNWIGHFVHRGYDVHVISTYPASVDEGAAPASLHVIPHGLAHLEAFPFFRRHFSVSRGGGKRNGRPSLFAYAVRRASAAARAAVPVAASMDAWRAARLISRTIQSIGPDLVHAMRIPYEGILAGLAAERTRIPLVLSVWGNDFTLHAAKDRAVTRLSRRVLGRADALHTDCERDIRLAHDAGFPADGVSIVLPGGGGVQSDLFSPGPSTARADWGLPADGPLVFNPRNFRPDYVRNDTFFAAIPLVREQVPNAVFACIGMRHNPIAEAWRERLPDPTALHLLPVVERQQMASLFRASQVTVSPSTHDGTPNTLLEAMACGAFPVAGDIESVREWIVSGENGLLCDPSDARALAGAIIRAITDTGLRDRARRANTALIAERADHARVMARAERFYADILQSGGP